MDKQTQQHPPGRYVIPALFWADYVDRCPVDAPEQMASLVRNVGPNRVEVECDDVQLGYLLTDAKYYAEADNFDGWRWPALHRSAQKTVAAIAKATGAA